VPVKYAHRKITIVASVDEVRLSFEDQLCGFDYARPLADWQLPECFAILRPPAYGLQQNL
jgi:hypothetical protein